MPEEVNPNAPQNEGLYNPNPIIGVVSPNIPLPEIDSLCVTLSNLKNNDVIKTSLNSLKDNIGENLEKCFTFQKNGNGQTAASSQINNTGTSAIMRVTSATYGVAHIHQSGTNNNSGLYKMFSFTDLQAVYRFAKGYAFSGTVPAPLFFNMMVVDGYTYIIFPKDLEAFKGMGDIFEDETDIKRLNRELNRIYDDYCNPEGANPPTVGHQNLARYLLMFLNNMGNDSNTLSGINFNVSLYRVSNDNNFAGKWKKIELDPNDHYQLKTPTPCN